MKSKGPKLWLKYVNYGMIFMALLVVMGLWFPWQIYVSDAIFMKAYRSGLWLLLFLCVGYAFFRVKSKKWWYWLFLKVMFGVIIVYSFIGLVWAVKSFPVYKGTYLLLYTNPENSDEKIEIVHNHGFVHGWNNVMQIKDFPSLGFRLERLIEPEKLNGKWKVHEDNPFCDSVGVFYFENGKIVE